jgi:hypothetical protein
MIMVCGDYLIAMRWLKFYNLQKTPYKIGGFLFYEYKNYLFHHSLVAELSGPPNLETPDCTPFALVAISPETYGVLLITPLAGTSVFSELIRG